MPNLSMMQPRAPVKVLNVPACAVLVNHTRAKTKGQCIGARRISADNLVCAAGGGAPVLVIGDQHTVTEFGERMFHDLRAFYGNYTVYSFGRMGASSLSYVNGAKSIGG